ncbi:MAG: TonB-dependent receptor [Sphingopyxis sp.]|nr:TonB-dependent receptor [Sphingopyxis sp.]
MKLHDRFLGVSLISIAVLTATPASAALDSLAVTDDPPRREQADDVIIVTGSRIARPVNLDSPIPITSIRAEDLVQGGDQSLGDMLNRLPQLNSTFAQANSTRFIGTSGLNLADLRGLGADRTLVLMDGRRSVTSTPGSFAVDINTIPTDLLDRVDIVTGGNSAVYGSDAVAGVVNFIMKRDYDGLTFSARSGVSSRGDRGSYSVSGLFGRNFDRGNITLSAEYSRSSTLLSSHRNGQTGAFTGTPGFATMDTDIACVLDKEQKPIPGNPIACDPNVRDGSDGVPDTYFFDAYPGNTFTNVSLGGTVITACPADTPPNAKVRAHVCAPFLSPTLQRVSDNYMFQPDGTLLRDRPLIDLRRGGGGVRGGRGASGVEGAMLLPGLERYNAMLLGRFELAPGAEFFVDGRYANITANQRSTQPIAVSLAGINSSFSLDNPYLSPQAKATIKTILGTNSDTAKFQMIRFLNDAGTRSENHKRETWSVAGGVRGEFGASGNWSYDAGLSWGRTETFFQTGGQFSVSRFNKATDAVRNAGGDIICRVNADADPANDDPNCRPLNLFGEGAPLTTPAGLAYVRHISWRTQWAESFGAIANIAGSSQGLFELPGGPVGFAIGAEYRREDAYSSSDPDTVAGKTTHNSSTNFNPPAIESKEVYGEIRIPLLANLPFVKELAVEASGRLSDYSHVKKTVHAYNAGLVYSPVPGVRFRAGYARSVRAPNLGNAYAQRSQTFSTIADPCSQTQISNKPNRARNCAEAGVPTELLLPDGTKAPWVNAPASSVSGFNQGNPDLSPEVGQSLTLGGVFQPDFLPGFSLSVDYYRIKVRKAIAGLSGQAIIDQCYDDPVTIKNPYCAAVFRRASPNPLENLTFDGQTDRIIGGFPTLNMPLKGPGFINQPYNYAALKASGIDAQLAYTYNFTPDYRIGLAANLSWSENREQFSSISEPARANRLHGVLGNPVWEGGVDMKLHAGAWDMKYAFRWMSKQTIGSWESQNSHQGRPPTNADVYPVKTYPAIGYLDLQLGFTLDKADRFYIGVDNVFDTLPPWGQTGTTEGGGIFSVTGRYFYAGVKLKL